MEVQGPQATTSAVGGEELRQIAEAQRRVRERQGERRDQVRALAHPATGLADADSLERVATRVDRLSKHVTGEPLPRAVKASSAAADPGAVIEAAIRRAAPKLGSAGEAALKATTPKAATARFLEAIVNTVDFVGVRYLEAGTLAARAGRSRPCRAGRRQELRRTLSKALDETNRRRYFRKKPG